MTLDRDHIDPYVVGNFNAIDLIYSAHGALTS